MEAQGARERPPAIQYLSIYCDISPLVLSSGLGSHARLFRLRLQCGTKAPMLVILQTAAASWNSMWEHWLPDFELRPVRGGLCCSEEFEKALDEIRLDTDHPAAP